MNISLRQRVQFRNIALRLGSGQIENIAARPFRLPPRGIPAFRRPLLRRQHAHRVTDRLATASPGSPLTVM